MSLKYYTQIWEKSACFSNLWDKGKVAVNKLSQTCREKPSFSLSPKEGKVLHSLWLQEMLPWAEPGGMKVWGFFYSQDEWPLFNSAFSRYNNMYGIQIRCSMSPPTLVSKTAQWEAALCGRSEARCASNFLWAASRSLWCHRTKTGRECKVSEVGTRLTFSSRTEMSQWIRLWLCH